MRAADIAAAISRGSTTLHGAMAAARLAARIVCDHPVGDDGLITATGALVILIAQRLDADAVFDVVIGALAEARAHVAARRASADGGSASAGCP